MFFTVRVPTVQNGSAQAYSSFAVCSDRISSLELEVPHCKSRTQFLTVLRVLHACWGPC
ncbi:unnamed protein product, partial [Nesidiocoris tenuis]